MRSSELRAIEAARVVQRPVAHRDVKPAKRNLAREVDAELRACGVRKIFRGERK
jgi:hypothetical protein